MRIGFGIALAFASALCGSVPPASAQESQAPAGFAFVLATTQNTAIPLPSADTDAGIVAAALAAKNYDVTAVRNLDQASLGSAIEEFKTRIKTAPSAPIVFYFSGPTLQSKQDNYLLSADTTLSTPADFKSHALSLSTLVADLGRISSGPKTILIDGARLPANLALPAPYLASFALPERAPNTIILLNTTPGLSVIENATPTNAFALALSEAIDVGAASSKDFVDRVILRTFDLSKGQQVAWSIGLHDKAAPVFSPTTGSSPDLSSLHSKMMSDLDATQGFAAAMLRRSIISYEEYILVKIQNPMTKVVRYVLAGLRETSVWRETATKPSAIGMWAYLKMYPRGPHAAEARAILTELNQPLSAPADAPVLSLVTAPPVSDELTLLAQTVPMRLDETVLDLQNIALKVRPSLPELSAEYAAAPKLSPSSSYFALPLPALDNAVAARIRLPANLPTPPVVEVPPEPKTTKKPVKAGVPTPPVRRTDGEPTEPAELPALFTITIPIGAPAEPAASPSTAPPVKKPKPKQTNDVFEQSFGSSSAQEALPY